MKMEIVTENMMTVRAVQNLASVHMCGRGEIEVVYSLLRSVVFTFYWPVGGNRTCHLFSSFFSYCKIGLAALLEFITWQLTELSLNYLSFRQYTLHAFCLFSLSFFFSCSPLSSA